MGYGKSEVFRWNISLRANLLFQKIALSKRILFHLKVILFTVQMQFQCKIRIVLQKNQK